jgi:hypothetical protein
VPDRLKKVGSGQPLNIPAATFNAFIDAAEYVRRQQQRQTVDPLVNLTTVGIVPIRNSSGADRSRFDVLGITGIVWTPTDNLDGFKNQPVLVGAAPTATELEKFVVLQEPVANGKIGRGLLVGATPVQIDIKDATDDYADVISGDATKLRSQPYGSAWIAYKESGTGVKWAFVVPGVQGSQLLLGKTSASHSKGASGTINVYRGATAGSESFTSGDTVLAWNHFADLASGKWVICARLQRNWRIIVGECP